MSARTRKEDFVLTERLNGNSKTVAPVGSVSADTETGARSELLTTILSSLEDDKALEIVSIDLRGKSEMADDMIIASGRSTRHVSAIAEHLADRLKTTLDRRCRIEGKEAADWVLIDCGDAVVHLFRPEVREFYQLEKMWSPGPSATQAGAAT